MRMQARQHVPELSGAVVGLGSGGQRHLVGHAEQYREHHVADRVLLEHLVQGNGQWRRSNLPRIDHRHDQRIMHRERRSADVSRSGRANDFHRYRDRSGQQHFRVFDLQGSVVGHGDEHRARLFRESIQQRPVGDLGSTSPALLQTVKPSWVACHRARSRPCRNGRSARWRWWLGDSPPPCCVRGAAGCADFSARSNGAGLRPRSLRRGVSGGVMQPGAGTRGGGRDAAANARRHARSRVSNTVRS